MTKPDRFPAHRGLRENRLVCPQRVTGGQDCDGGGQRLWEPRGGNWSRSEGREGFLEEGVSALGCEGRVHMSLLRE